MSSYKSPMIVKSYRLEPYTVRAIEMIKKSTGRASASEVIRDAIDKYVADNNFTVFTGDNVEVDPTEELPEDDD